MLLDSLVRRSSDEGSFPRQVMNWKEEFLLELCGLSIAINAIDQSCFEGHNSLYPSMAQWFEEFLFSLHKMVSYYNRSLAAGIEQMNKSLTQSGSEEPKSQDAICLPDLMGKAETVASSQITYLMDLDKMEALDGLGETKRVRDLVSRYMLLSAEIS